MMKSRTINNVTDPSGLKLLVQRDTDLASFSEKLCRAAADQQARGITTLGEQVQMCEQLFITGLHLGADLKPSTIRSKLLEAAYSLIRAEQILLLTVDHITKEFEVTRSRDANSSGVRIAISDHQVAAECLRSQTVVRATESTNALDRQYSDTKWSILCAPLVYNNRVHGVLQAMSRASASSIPVFKENDENAIHALTLQASALLRNAWLHEQVVKRAELEGRMAKPLGLISNDLSTEISKSKIINSMYDLLQCERVSLFLYEPQTAEFLCVESADILGMRIPEGHGCVGACKATMKVINLSDPYNDERFNPDLDRQTGFRTRTLICAPVSAPTATSWQWCRQ